MRKDIVIVDWLLILLVLLMIVSVAFGLQLENYIPPALGLLVVIHIIQHWRFYANSLKRNPKE